VILTERNVLARLWAHRALVFTLVRRQYQLRYRQSAVGFWWALLPPLATLGVGAVLFQQVARLDTGEAPYGVSTLAALIPWTFFANSVILGVPSIVGSVSMITRLSFPRAVLPVSMVGLSLLDLVITTVAFLAFALIQGTGVPLTALWAPVLLLLEIPLVLGVVLLGSALNVFARDIRLAVPLVVQFWLFLTPVMYVLENAPPQIRSLYLLNPMTGLVESFRRVLVYGQSPSAELLVPTMIGAGAALLIGVWYFGSTEPRFADVI
jgi:lipopolysaccharide transport system permease protein